MNKLIEEIKDLGLYNLDNPFKIEIIPNDGNIFESIGEAVVTYDEARFNFYIYKGIFKKQLVKEAHEFFFQDLRAIEFGKYGFKHYYVKLVFTKTKYLVFSYSFKDKNYLQQTKNIEGFFSILLALQEKLTKKAE